MSNHRKKKTRRDTSEIARSVVEQVGVLLTPAVARLLRDSDLSTDLRHLRARSQQDLSLTKLRYDLFTSVTFLRHNQTSIWSQKPHDSTRSLDSVMGVRSDGSLEFVYQAGDINLHSTDMEWLVVQSATKVRFKGQATVNGEGSYTFKVTAEDNGQPGTNDTF